MSGTKAPSIWLDAGVGLGAVAAVSALPGTAVGAPAGVLIAALACAILSRKWGPASVIAGSVAAFALLGPWPALVGAPIFVAALHAERATRARGPLSATIVLALALAAGAIYVALDAAFSGGALELRVAALVVATIALALPSTVAIDDRIGATIRKTARATRGHGRVRLLRALVLRRRTAMAPKDPVHRTLELAWEGLATMLTEHAQHRSVSVRVQALERAHRAARTLEDAQREIVQRPEGLDDVEHALRDELDALRVVQGQDFVR